jgi:hypothetical protein
VRAVVRSVSENGRDAKSDSAPAIFFFLHTVVISECRFSLGPARAKSANRVQKIGQQVQGKFVGGVLLAKVANKKKRAAKDLRNRDQNTKHHAQDALVLLCGERGKGRC